MGMIDVVIECGYCRWLLAFGRWLMELIEG